MASETDVANLALTLMGSDRINALSDSAERARVINGVFSMLRDAELRKHRWAFSIKRDSLAASSDEPAFGFARKFPLPADFLALAEVQGGSLPSLSDYRGGEEPAYTIESGHILTDLTSPLYIRYVRKVTAAGEFDPSFVVVLAARIALECVERLSQSSTKKADIERAYSRALRDAMKAGAIEKASRPLDDSTWVAARL